MSARSAKGHPFRSAPMIPSPNRTRKQEDQDERRRAARVFLASLLRSQDLSGVPPHPFENQNWEVIVREAIREGLIPFLYKWIVAAESAPAKIDEEVRRTYFEVWARNSLLLKELVVILRALEASGLPCAPLRGAALAERLYGQAIARPMGDLDLLIRKPDLPRIAVILQSLGFREMDRRPGFAQEFSYTRKFYKDMHGWIIVEPHWTLAYPPFTDGFDMQPVWERCVKGRVAGVEIWQLGREDLLLHLCLHIAHRDGSAPFLWLYELHRLLMQEGKNLNWPLFVRTSRKTGVAFAVSQILAGVTALFDTSLPDSLFDSLAPSCLDPAKSGVAQLLAESGVEGRESLALFFHLKGLRAKARYSLSLLFPSPEFMRVQYGLSTGGELIAGYLRRFCHLSWQGMKGVAKLI
ncbi:MAG: nucleotidyltransferase family protein [Acidobacteria bacterium]|nr:nucleotidyltransferase family protein [Acidobacteriota bacterium]